MLLGKSNINYWMFLTIILGVCMIFLGLFALTYMRNPARSIGELPSTDIPEENTLYFGYHHATPVVFLRRDEQKSADSNVYLGDLEESQQIPFFDFRDIAEPQKIFSAGAEVQSIESFTIDNSSEKDIIYVLLAYDDDEIVDLLTGVMFATPVNKLIRIDPETLVDTEIWSHKVGSETYSGADGPAYIDSVFDDQYIALGLFDCPNCEGRRAGTLLLNRVTGREKYYQDTDNIVWSDARKKVFYQKLKPFIEPCYEGSFNCGDDGEHTVYRPSGLFLSDNLP